MSGASALIEGAPERPPRRRGRERAGRSVEAARVAAARAQPTGFWPPWRREEPPLFVSHLLVPFLSERFERTEAAPSLQSS